MVPSYWNGLQQGERMEDRGTAVEVGCVVCGTRFTRRYYASYTDGKTYGPYCAEHFTTERRS